MCDLTKPDDCFPAMAGLAKQMTLPGRGGDYFAGLFKDTLLFDLSWSGGLRNLAHDPSASTMRQGGISSPNLPAEQASLVSRAPSWSWGSAMRPMYLVGRGADYVRTFATVKDAMFITRSSDLQADPSSMLIIEAPCLPLKVTRGFHPEESRISPTGVSAAGCELGETGSDVFHVLDFYAALNPQGSVEISTFKPESFDFVVWLDRPTIFEPDRLEHDDIVYLLSIGAWLNEEEGESHGKV